MNTDLLIDHLAKDVRAVPRYAIGQRLWVGVLGGSAVAILLILIVLGFRSDLGLAMQGSIIWMKWAYTLSLGIAAIVMLARLARPEPVDLKTFWPVAIPFVLLALVAGAEMARVPSTDWPTMWLGHTWKKCPWLVLMLSAPIFGGLLWSFRRLAPTRLRAAGAAAGFAAGAWAATLYCLHCPEVSALFVLTWYSLGIALAAAVGAMVGPHVLRW